MVCEYDINEFINACGQDGQVIVLANALQSAKSDFNLNMQKAVLEFIAYDGLETPQYQNTKPWENNPDKNNPIQVDAYGFHSGKKDGYIAFFRNPKTAKWSIKSFKENRNPLVRNNSLAEQLQTLLMEFKR